VSISALLTGFDACALDSTEFLGPMIFGFNTDIKHEDTVYHVQSEARTNDLLLQTQVFVRGRCIGKKASSYAEQALAPDFSDNRMHELLKAQHRTVIDTIRDGKMDNLFAPSTATGIMEIADAGTEGQGLALHWVNSEAVYEQNSVVMKFLVSHNGSKVEGARLTTRLHVSSDAPIYSQAVTDSSGTAEMKIVLDEAILADAAVLVQASDGDRHTTRKFRLKKT
jgi:hypothetical protein